MTISVVIPVKNRPGLILQAIESCMQQTHLPLEIIIVDDGSTDTTTSVIATAAKSNHRIKLIRHENSSGAAIARNIGAAAVKGEYIAFLDSDDRWDSNKLKLQYEIMQSTPDCVLVGCGVKYEYEKRKARISIPKENVSFDDLAASNILGSTSVGMVKTSAFHAIGGFDETLPNCEDWDLWIRLSLIGTVKNVAEPLLFYTYVAQNKLSRDTEKLYRGHRMVFEKITAISSKKNLPHSKNLTALHLLKEAEIRIRIGDGAQQAWSCIAKAIASNQSAPVIKRAVKLSALFIASWGRS